MSLATLLEILKTASSKIPQLKYAWGLLGISVTAALIIKILGESQASIIIIGLTIVGIILVFITTVAIGKSNQRANLPAKILIWATTIFFIIFLGFTVTAFAKSWPCNWVIFLDLRDVECQTNYRNKIELKSQLQEVIKDINMSLIRNQDLMRPALQRFSHTPTEENWNQVLYIAHKNLDHINKSIEKSIRYDAEITANKLLNKVGLASQGMSTPYKSIFGDVRLRWGNRSEILFQIIGSEAPLRSELSPMIIRQRADQWNESLKSHFNDIKVELQNIIKSL